MLNQVKTTVINKSRTPFKLSYNRGLKAIFLPGKEVTFDFDLMSTLDRTAKNALQTAVNRGTLVVSTKIVSADTVITIDGTNVSFSRYVPEKPKHISAPVKKQQKDTTITAKNSPDNYIGGMSAGIANSREAKFKAAFGVTTESNMDNLIEDITVPANGKLEKKASVVPIKKVDTNAKDTVSIFKSEIADKEAVEKEAEEAESAANIDEQLEITKYLGEKDYSIVYVWLEEHYSSIFPKKLTKTAVRKCRTYDELMEAIERVNMILDE